MSPLERLVTEALAGCQALDAADPEAKHAIARRLEWTLREAHARALKLKRRLAGEKDPKVGP